MVTYNHIVLYWTTSFYLMVGVAMIIVSSTNTCLMNKLFTNTAMSKQNKILNCIAYVFGAAYIMRAIGDSVVIYQFAGHKEFANQSDS
jgi:Kef-type K+ transport system membrane component KefB